jgi:hypothetical protein
MFAPSLTLSLLALLLLHSPLSTLASSFSPSISNLEHRQLLQHANLDPIIPRLHRRKQSSKRSTTPVDVSGVGTKGATVARLAASAPGVTNSLGRDEDPSPLTYHTSNGQQAYLFPSVDFGYNLLFRNSTNLDDLYSSNPTVLFRFSAQVGTEAADVMMWNQDTVLATVSTIEDNTMRAITFSLSGLINGTSSSNVVSHGRIVNTKGTALQGFDSHVFSHPNGHHYLLYSNHVSIRIARMTSYNVVEDDTMLVA